MNKDFDIEQSIIPSPVNNPQLDVSYYQKLSAICEQEKVIAESQERRFTVIANELAQRLTEKRNGLIAAWDDTAKFEALSGEYERLRTASEIAEAAKVRYTERHKNLFVRGLEMAKNVRHVGTLARQELEANARQQLEREQRDAKRREKAEALAIRRQEKEAKQAPLLARQEAKREEENSYSEQLGDWLKSFGK